MYNMLASAVSCSAHKSMLGFNDSFKTFNNVHEISKRQLGFPESGNERLSNVLRRNYKEANGGGGGKSASRGCRVLRRPSDRRVK